MSRLSTLFKELRKREEKAMGLFVTNGFPNPEVMTDLLHTLDQNGADFIELGMPFSDPLAEGLPIQRSSEVALKWGVRMPDAFDVVRAFRQKSETPVLLMGYINPVFRYGIGNFCRDARSAGVDGLILPDLPPHEAGIIRNEAADHGLALVNLVAPNSSNERVSKIDQLTDGFVYAVSVTGLTGSSIANDSVTDYLRRIRPLVSRNPLLVGFGISNHQQAMSLSEHTDGFIVGSAVIRSIETLWADENLNDQERLQKLGQFVHTLKFGS